MKKTFLFIAFGRLTLAAIVSAVGSVSAWGASKTVTAEFNPDPANPMRNEFKNTTPSSGYCVPFPGVCASNGFFSLAMGINANANATIQANHTDPRKGAMFKIPTDWRTVEVTHTATGEKESLDVRISGLSVYHRFPVPAGDISGPGGHETMWTNRSWRYSPPPCTGNYTQQNWANRYQSYWHFPENVGVCAKQAAFNIPDFEYIEQSFTYELRTPKPLSMATGDYTGAITYTVGPGADFDWGDIMMPTDTLFTINFNLKVQHQLKVEIPPGGNKIELLPQGGWQAWLNQGRKPTRLFRDQIFNISSSGRFKMELGCQNPNGNTCALREPTSGHEVPLNISVTLPNGLTNAAGQPVIRLPLLQDGIGTELFKPGFYVDRKSGALHFEITREHVENMLTGDEKTYSGNVTVIWNSEV
ncbi:hypothetical protein [Pseudomonas izuensis]|uniref:Fimbrial protein n=1 Tax=Pseudomonas izuensis TaxID=2684212 RepID=A0ABM7RU98_9PSED|nr:hypothetical protein [Pseudomonas izuensis]BCX66367.1 hypothetical protein LAB08_R09830 [Pseudomonas izuensis]